MYIRGGDWNGYRFKTHEDGNVDDPIVGWNVLTLDMDNPDFIEGGADLTVANTLRIRLYHDDLDETFTEGDIIMDYLVYDTPMKAKNKAGVDNKAYQFSSEMAVTIPVGHWKMNGDSTDSIGSFDGTDTNITYPSGKLNQSASFASDTSHIDVAADEDLNLKNEMSVSMWYKATNTPSGGSYRYLFRNDGGTWDASIKFFVIHETSGEISWSIVPEGAGDSNDYYRLFTSGDALTPGTWYHITCTYNNVTGVMNIYINSAIVATSTETPADIIDLNIPIIIGGDGGGTQNVLGEMDDVRIYDEALTQPEINKIYNGDTGTETSKIYTGAKTYVTTNATPDELGIGVGRSYSYSVWVYPTGISNVSRNQYSYIVTKRGWHCGLLFNTDSSFKMTMETASHTGSASAGGTTGKSLNQWYHVVGTYNKDNQEVKIYVDGELEGTDTGSGEEYNSTNDVLIGRSSTSLGDWAYPFGGKIDDVRIYSRYLKADDVKGLYNSGVVNYEENDYIDFGTILVDSNNQSISFWYKTTDDRFQMLFQHELSSSNSNIEFEPNGNTLRVESKTNNFWDKTFSTGIDIDDGEWHNYIFTFGSDSRLYVDGILADTETENTDSEQFEYRYIGGYGTHNFSYGHTPKGDFDDIRIYDRQLGYDEVQSLYNLNAGNEGTVYTVNRIGLESQPTIELNTYRCSQIPLEAE